MPQVHKFPLKETLKAAIRSRWTRQHVYQYPTYARRLISDKAAEQMESRAAGTRSAAAWAASDNQRLDTRSIKTQ